MKLVRGNVFETNSSSTHALVIYTKDEALAIPDFLKLDFDEFGWGYQVYKDTHSKASYIITLIYSMEDEIKNNYLKLFTGFLDKYEIDYILPKVQKDSWGFDDIGYVDHGEEAYEWLFNLLKDEDKLFKFLFNDKSYISTGNDNDRGIYIPGIGYEDDYRSYYENSKHTEQEWDEKMKELKSQGYEIDYKGN